MRLADFILDNIEPILQAWKDFAKTITPASIGMDAVALRDHAEQMLRTIAADLRTSQTRNEAIAKSHGEAPPADAETAAETHAVIRQFSGFTVEQMVSEYRALRTGVLMLWMPHTQLDHKQVMDDLIRFNEAVDQALSESVVSYSGGGMHRAISFSGFWGMTCAAPWARSC